MSTNSVPPDKPQTESLGDWLRHNSHQAGRLRLMLFGLGLLVIGWLGTRWAVPASPTVYNAVGRCTYGAERYNPVPLALPAVVSQTFAIQWTIQNTGSCHVWTGDVYFVQRDKELASLENYIPISTQPVVTETQNANPLNVAYVTTDLIAPGTPGEYVTEWDLRTSDGRRFGPVMRQRVQVVEAANFPPPAIPNEPPAPFLLDALGRLWSLFYHMLPALLGAIFILWRANDFLNKLYKLPGPTTSLWHVIGFTFGISVVNLYVHQGKLQDDTNTAPAKAIGGPGWITVGDGNAVLLERGAGFSRIVGPGYHRLQPHERVRQVIDLRTHYRKDFQKVLTKDGIPVQMEVDLTFRVTEKNLPDDPPPPPPPPLSPYNRLRRRLHLRVRHDLLETSRPHRFSRETVRRLTYETAVFSPDTPPDWTASFYNVRSGDITDQIANRRLDEISAPEDTQIHPRAEIARKGLDDARDAASRAAPGVEILDMTLGVIEPQDNFKQVTAQMIANWNIEWERRAKILRAKAEAKRTQLLEEARAEAQANMIQALTEGYRIAIGNNPNVSKDVIALRFIDTLETLLTEQTAGEKSGENQAVDVATVLRLMRREL
jgi:regulator of protease activity HflC (stomatin/prohibitin superfamily)